MKRIISILAFIICTIYAPVELTRLISIDWLGTHWKFAFEIAGMWILYSFALVLFWRLLWARSIR